MARDPASLRPEDLLEHAAWLRGLARTLAQGSPDADDLVQETWVAALRFPPRADGPLRPWLAEVLRNLFRMRLRGDGRRRVRDAESGATTGDEASPSAATLLERLEAQRLLAGLVSELEEPYRATVLLRYFEGLSAAEIARSQGIPPGTVRWRLKTGLDRLRGRLDGSAGDPRRRYMLLLPLVRTGVGGGLASGLKGALLMKRALQVGSVVLLVLLGFGAYLRVRQSRHSTAASPVAMPPSSPPLALSGPTTQPVAATSPHPSNPAVQLVSATVRHDPSVIAGSFQGQVLDWASGEPVPSAAVTFALGELTATVETDASGHFTFAPAQPGLYNVAIVTKEGYLPFAPEIGQSSLALAASAGIRIQDVTIYLVPALDYHGTVLGPDAKPVAGAVVHLLGVAQALEPIQDTYTADASGQFTFHAPDNTILEARQAGFPPGRAILDGNAQTTHSLTIHLGTASGADTLGAQRIAGRVIDGTGAPVIGARVVATPGDGAPVAPTTELHPDGATQSDGTGAFAIQGLDVGTYRVGATAPGFAPSAAVIAQAGATDVSLALHGGGTLTGRVVLSGGGGPVPAFTIIVSSQKGALEESQVAARSVVNGDGLFSIPDLEPGAYRVRATAHDYAPSAEVDADVVADPATPSPIELDVTAGGTITGQVQSADGSPLQYAKVSVDEYAISSLNSVGGGDTPVPVSDTAITGADGHFELPGVPPGLRSITIGADDHNPRIVSGLEVTDGATIGPVTIELTPVAPGAEPQLEVVGIGAKLAPGADSLLIQAVIPGGGAEAAGLVAGDDILAVDGVSVTALGFGDSIQHIRGPEGSVVRLSVRKGAGGQLVDLAVQRHKIGA